jgi:hypothetical protein
LRVLFALFALVDKSAKIKRLCGVSLIFSYYNLLILLLYIFSAQISKPAVSNMSIKVPRPACIYAKKILAH